MFLILSNPCLILSKGVKKSDIHTATPGNLIFERYKERLSPKKSSFEVSMLFKAYKTLLKFFLLEILFEIKLFDDAIVKSSLLISAI